MCWWSDKEMLCSSAPPEGISSHSSCVQSLRMLHCSAPSGSWLYQRGTWSSALLHSRRTPLPRGGPLKHTHTTTGKANNMFLSERDSRPVTANKANCNSKNKYMVIKKCSARRIYEQEKPKPKSCLQNVIVHRCGFPHSYNYCDGGLDVPLLQTFNF